MKRSLFDSEYDKVRRSAGYARPRYDIDDEPSAEDQAATAERVRAANADFQERMSKRTAWEAEQEAKRRAEGVALSLRANESMRLAEFDAAGVEPPLGFRCSLPLLLLMGWTIDSVSGKNVLVRPFYRSARPKPEEEESSG